MSITNGHSPYTPATRQLHEDLLRALRLEADLRPKRRAALLAREAKRRELDVRILEHVQAGTLTGATRAALEKELGLPDLEAELDALETLVRNVPAVIARAREKFTAAATREKRAALEAFAREWRALLRSCLALPVRELRREKLPKALELAARGHLWLAAEPPGDLGFRIPARPTFGVNELLRHVLWEHGAELDEAR